MRVDNSSDHFEWSDDCVAQPSSDDTLERFDSKSLEQPVTQDLLRETLMVVNHYMLKLPVIEILHKDFGNIPGIINTPMVGTIQR